MIDTLSRLRRLTPYDGLRLMAEAEQRPDTEVAHAQADAILVALVRKYVPQDGEEIAAAYHRVGKWYA